MVNCAEMNKMKTTSLTPGTSFVKIDIISLFIRILIYISRQIYSSYALISRYKIWSISNLMFGKSKNVVHLSITLGQVKTYMMSELLQIAYTRAFFKHFSYKAYSFEDCSLKLFHRQRIRWAELEKKSSFTRDLELSYKQKLSLYFSWEHLFRSVNCEQSIVNYSYTRKK